MKPCVIRCEHLVKDYGHLRGNFDLSLSLLEGECLGISGENGAGKTTLLRQIMGFIKPDSGSIQIYQYDAYTDAAKTKQYIIRAALFAEYREPKHLKPVNYYRTISLKKLMLNI